MWSNPFLNYVSQITAERKKVFAIHSSGTCYLGAMSIQEFFEWFKELWEPRESSWVLIHTHHKVLLGKRSKKSKRPGEWNFFGGRIDEGERPIETALRETFEETGLELHPHSLRYLGRIQGYHYFAYAIEEYVLPEPTREISKFGYFEWGFLPKKLHPKTKRFIDVHGRKWWKKVLDE